MRYQLRPVGFGSNSDFYMYVSHYKASSGTTNQDRRNVEATEIRQDADALGPSAHIIYSGDFNLTSGSSEPAWATLTAPGNGQAFDPTGAAGWTNNSGSLNYLYSESTSTLNARFDFQLVTSATRNQPGLQLAADTSDPFTGNFPSSKYPYAYEVFGNNGTTALNGVTNTTGTNGNTSVSDLPNASTVLADLMEPYSGNGMQFVGSDHLPVVADYKLVGVSALPAAGDFNRDGLVNLADLPAMMTALADLNAYETSQNLTDAQLQVIGDLNGDTKVTNADLQRLVNLIASGGGGSLTAVPEPASILLMAIAGLMMLLRIALPKRLSTRRV
jgi:hypothetical protein